MSRTPPLAQEPQTCQEQDFNPRKAFSTEVQCGYKGEGPQTQFCCPLAFAMKLSDRDHDV